MNERRRTKIHTKAPLDSGCVSCPEFPPSRGLHSYKHVPAIRLTRWTVLCPRPISFVAKTYPVHLSSIRPSWIYYYLHQQRTRLRSRSDSKGALWRVFSMARRYSGDFGRSWAFSTVGSVQAQRYSVSIARILRMIATANNSVKRTSMSRLRILCNPRLASAHSGRLPQGR
jgi:hypothetical protein